MSAYGLSPLGTGLGPFGGPGLITILGVLPEATNAFLVVFDRYPDTFGPLAYYSATNPDNYLLSAIDPTYTSATTTLVPPGTVVPTRTPRVFKAEVDEEDEKQIRLFTDAKLEPGVQYSVEASSSIQGREGQTFAGPVEFTFYAPLLPDQILPEERREERYRDLAYQMYGDQAGYQYDANGDIGIQGAQDSLTKRLHRRVFSREGDFAWTTNYGAGISVKALARAGMLQNLAERIRDQFLREPDVKNASVVTRIARAAQGTFIDIKAKVLREDDTVTRVDLREPVE